jgi:hypothetical protein
LRYPIDGASATRIAVPPKVGGNPQLYIVGPAPTVTPDGLLKLWAIESHTAQASIVLQWIPLPRWISAPTRFGLGLHGRLALHHTDS